MWDVPKSDISRPFVKPVPAQREPDYSQPFVSVGLVSAGLASAGLTSSGTKVLRKKSQSVLKSGTRICRALSTTLNPCE